MLQRTTCRTQRVQAGLTPPRSQSKRCDYLHFWHRSQVCWLIRDPNCSSKITPLLTIITVGAVWSITTTQPEERTSCGGTTHTRSLKSMPKLRTLGYVAWECGPQTQQGMNPALHRVCGMRYHWQSRPWHHHMSWLSNLSLSLHSFLRSLLCLFLRSPQMN